MLGLPQAEAITSIGVSQSIVRDACIQWNMLELVQGKTATTIGTSKATTPGTLGGAGMFGKRRFQKPRLDRLNLEAFATA